MDLALMVEDKLRIGSGKKLDNRSSISYASKGANSYYHFSPSVKSRSTAYSTGSILPRTNISSGHSMLSTGSSSRYPVVRPVGQVPRLTDKELQVKREKGLCYRCDDKWSLGHRCKRKELSVLLTCEKDDEETEVIPISQGSEECVKVNFELTHPEISLNSVMGITSPKTLKLLGQIEDQAVVVMIDLGATHNFISKDVVNRIGIPVTPSKSFGVSLGTGDSVQGEG